MGHKSCTVLKPAIHLEFAVTFHKEFPDGKLKNK